MLGETKPEAQALSVSVLLVHLSVPLSLFTHLLTPSCGCKVTISTQISSNEGLGRVGYSLVGGHLGDHRHKIFKIGRRNRSSVFLVFIVGYDLTKTALMGTFGFVSYYISEVKYTRQTLEGYILAFKCK